MDIRHMMNSRRVINQFLAPESRPLFPPAAGFARPSGNKTGTGPILFGTTIAVRRRERIGGCRGLRRFPQWNAARRSRAFGWRAAYDARSVNGGGRDVNNTPRIMASVFSAFRCEPSVLLRWQGRRSRNRSFQTFASSVCGPSTEQSACRR